MEQQRANCWSITINNPKEEEYMLQKPPGWELIGQLEMGAEGTQHFQGMLKTQQVRFSAVKKVFPRAHIEVAKNKAALQKYVNKEDTRIAAIDTTSTNIPTLFNYQHQIAKKWDDDGFKQFQRDALEQMGDNDYDKLSIGDIALLYVDELVNEDIKLGMIGVEFIAINPMWRSAWKRFWKSMIIRERLVKENNISSDDIEDGSTQTNGTENSST